MFSNSIVQKIAGELRLKIWQVENVVKMIEEEASIPFISRYRKEKTGSLDEVMLTQIRDRSDQLYEIEKRKNYILKTIKEQGNLTQELQDKIAEADTMNVLEDLYLPYKPKRRTRATIAREKGLESLAKILFEQKSINKTELAQKYVNSEKGVNDIEDALQGARDIIAEWIAEDNIVRGKLRKIFLQEGIVVSKVIKGKESEGQKYKDYFDFHESVKKIPSHRMLAMRRGEKEMYLSLDIRPDENKVIQQIENLIIQNDNESARQVKLAIIDGYRRLLKPSMENEIRMKAKNDADAEAISVFADNLRQLLLSPPLGRKRILALDPGFKTGCKVVCLDMQGKLLYNTTLFPNEPQKEVSESAKIINQLIEEYNIDAVAIGNGTASRETESFIKSIGLTSEINVVMVNESGASVYSASEVARDEFPEYDITVRGAVSIGRRLMDPLAELVKIDPKSIGVGQYQHDVDQAALKKSLDDVVISCVNGVGVELNTASKELLSYVSGLGPQLARNIVQYRNENGPFKSRESLKNVKRMGEKVFEQSAGFLRIRDGSNPLDASAVHPERYDLVKQMAMELSCTIKDLIDSEELRRKINIADYVSKEVGLPTLEDIMSELNRPGRDPREEFEIFKFDESVKDIKDLMAGMILPGIVTNITKFGAFIDIGVHQDGLVHISQLSDDFITDPSEIVKINQKVTVRVIDVDSDRKRISLSMKSESKTPGKKDITEKPQKEKSLPNDLQSKLTMLKGKFKTNN